MESRAGTVQGVPYLIDKLLRWARLSQKSNIQTLVFSFCFRKPRNYQDRYEWFYPAKGAHKACAAFCGHYMISNYDSPI